MAGESVVKPDDEATKNSTSTLTTTTTTATTTHRGSCHCGAVRFEFDAPRVLRAVECNCSICSLKGNPYAIVPEKSFRLLQGEDSLTEYHFETKRAKHLFCKLCGVQSFYRPRSNPEGVSVLVPAIDPATIEKVEVGNFDGRNWEEAFAKGKPAPCE